MLDSPQKEDLPFLIKIEKITDVEKKALEFMPNLANFGFSKDEIATYGTKEDAMSSKEEKMLGSRDVKSSSLKGRLLTTTMTPGTT
jgi:hypothetical protein